MAVKHHKWSSTKRHYEYLLGQSQNMGRPVDYRLNCHREAQVLREQLESSK